MIFKLRQDQAEANVAAPGPRRDEVPERGAAVLGAAEPAAAICMLYG